jgi:quercetin dioxygenase-like cupin family protein
MTITKLVLVLVCLMALPLEIKEAKVTPLFSKDLPDFPGMITVEYPPGSSDPIHRHNADAFVYVLEGSIVMQLPGGKEVTLTPGQTFYEGPDDVHVVGKNASQTNRRNSWCSWLRTRAHPYWCRRTKSKNCGRAGATQGENGRLFADEARIGVRSVVWQHYGKTMIGSDALLAIG